jgi:GntR family transcriptional regulator, sialic acid-inducible nan operon repressor
MPSIYEAVAARDPMRAFLEMSSHLRLISELYRESKRLSEEILRQVARDVAGRMERERESVWTIGGPRDAVAGSAKAKRKAGLRAPPRKNDGEPSPETESSIDRPERPR